MKNLMIYEEFVGAKIKNLTNKIKNYFKEECPECKSKNVDDDYYPKNGIHEMTCKNCSYKWKRTSNETGW